MNMEIHPLTPANLFEEYLSSKSKKGEYRYHIYIEGNQGDRKMIKFNLFRKMTKMLRKVRKVMMTTSLIGVSDITARVHPEVMVGQRGEQDVLETKRRNKEINIHRAKERDKKWSSLPQSL